MASATDFDSVYVGSIPAAPANNKKKIKKLQNNIKNTK